MVRFAVYRKFSRSVFCCFLFVSIFVVPYCESRTSVVSVPLTTDYDDRPYEEIFDKGYEPFNDNSELSEDKALHLGNTERCNIMFAEFLVKNKAMLTKSPPDLPAKVSIMLIVTNIYEISEKDQTVTLTMFIELSWRDRRFLLATDENCSDVSHTIPNFSEIWFPIWTIENSAERTLYFEAWEKFPAVIHNRSVVVWITSFRIVINCAMKMETFPFDAQNCYFMIRSPHYFVSELQYYVYGRDQAILLWNENVSHPLWKLTGQMARPTSSNVSGIELWFRLERKPNFYIWTLMIPTTLISVSTVLAFVLPSHSSEKLQTILTGILAYFLLMLTLNEVTPQASDSIPVLTLFFVFLIALGIVGSIVCAIIVRIANGEKNRPARKRNAHLKESRFSWLPSYTSEILNDIFLFVYLLMVGGCYAWLAMSTMKAREDSDFYDKAQYNFTKIQYF